MSLKSVIHFPKFVPYLLLSRPFGNEIVSVIWWCVVLRQVIQLYFCEAFIPLNHLHLNMDINILHTVLSTFLNKLTRRICKQSQTFLISDHFLYSHYLHVWFSSFTRAETLADILTIIFTFVTYCHACNFRFLDKVS